MVALGGSHSLSDSSQDSHPRHVIPLEKATIYDLHEGSSFRLTVGSFDGVFAAEVCIVSLLAFGRCVC